MFLIRGVPHGELLGSGKEGPDHAEALRGYSPPVPTKAERILLFNHLPTPEASRCRMMEPYHCAMAYVQHQPNLAQRAWSSFTTMSTL